MKSKISIKYFPFAPGIPWSVKSGKYIIPQIITDIWGTVLKNRDAVVVVNGGLIEAYVSLIFLEVINSIAPEKKIYWCGDSKFNQLIFLNRLATICAIEINNEILQKYPTPIFLDKQKYFYFNVLNNYLQVNTISRNYSHKDRRPIIKQMINNITINIDNILPQIRHNELPNELAQWIKMNKFYFNQPYICLFPDRGFSIHKFSGLGWTANEICSFGMMLNQVGVRLVVFTNSPHLYQNNFIITSPIRFDFIFHFLQKARAILSEEIDFILMAGMFSKNTLISKNHKHELNILKNMRTLKLDRVIYMSRDLSPKSALEFLIQGIT